jgi:preprotein translocase subunit SecE
MAETIDKGAQADGATGDRLLLAAAGAALLAGLVAFYLATWPVYARWAALLVGLAAAVGTFAVSGVGRSLWEFVLASRVELRKMVWPTWDDTVRTTGLVILFVVILGAFFWFIDLLLGYASRQLLGGGV